MPVDTTTSPPIKEGCYVEAWVYDKQRKSRNRFHGMVIQVAHGEMLIRFMKEVETGQYVWPELDEWMIPVYDIIRVLSPPSVITKRRGLVYIFE